MTETATPRSISHGALPSSLSATLPKAVKMTIGIAMEYPTSKAKEINSPLVRNSFFSFDSVSTYLSILKKI